MRRFGTVSSVATLVTVLLGGVALAGTTDEFLSRVWERHHNVLSWYVRPLFILPLAW